MSSKSRAKAVVLLSGGMDSVTALAVAKDAGYSCYALSVDYGQRSQLELRAAGDCARFFDVAEHRVLDLDLSFVKGSALTDRSIPVPRESSAGIPLSYVPARNTVFFSLALAWAESVEAVAIYSGINAVDYSGYPDCRPEYLRAFQELVQLATRSTVEGGSICLNAPLLLLSKVEIIKLGLSLGVDYGMTISCYQPSADEPACGSCDSCMLRAGAFRSIGMDDPLGQMSFAQHVIK